MTDDINTLARRATHETARLPLDVRRWHDQAKPLVADGYPRGSDAAHVAGGDTSDPTYAAAIVNTTGTGTGYRVQDNHDLIAYQLRVILEACAIIGTVTRQVTVHATENDRCSRTIDPLCDNLRAGTGTAARHGLCDNCWAAGRCPACNERLAVQRRFQHGPHAGRYGCAGCIRAEQRAS